MSAYDYKLIGSFRFNPDTQEYIGAIAKQEGHELTILTVGCEATETAIMDWIKETIALMRSTNRTDVQASDMHDREMIACGNAH
jgi:hypothetical protein